MKGIDVGSVYRSSHMNYIPRICTQQRSDEVCIAAVHRFMVFVSMNK